KAFLATTSTLPLSGCVFVSVLDADKPQVVDAVIEMRRLGFNILATGGTARYLLSKGVPVERVYKVQDGERPHIVDRMANGEVDLVVNTTQDKKAVVDSFSIRETALMSDIPYVTTIEAFKAVVAAIGRLRKEPLGVRSLQEYYGDAV
ncbi:MAG: carbamoyl phosphate synthase large subunit, partial [Myxococcota bacterium]|nr:carbamoyl phosphate synthase large subunit [Myxococcota bacterium]